MERLTEDLILEILFRLPVKSAVRCALVCKTWSTLILNPNFAMDHLEFSATEKTPLILAVDKHNVISTLEFEDNSNITRCVRLVELENQFFADKTCTQGRIQDLNNGANYVDGQCFLIGSCHGLVCICHELSLFIWNPVIGEKEEITLPDDYTKICMDVDVWWFGYLPSKNEYGILLSYFGTPMHGDRFCIYSFGTCPWREIRVIDEMKGFLDEVVSIVFVGEALYWFSPYDSTYICKFDLGEETFKNVPFLIEDLDYLKKYEFVSLDVTSDESLCAVFQLNNLVADMDHMVVLTLDQCGDLNYSWKKWCKINLRGRISRDSMYCFGFTYSGFLCFQEQCGIKIIDLMDDQPPFTIARCDNPAAVVNTINYVESLISPCSLLQKFSSNNNQG